MGVSGRQLPLLARGHGQVGAYQASATPSERVMEEKRASISGRVALLHPPSGGPGGGTVSHCGWVFGVLGNVRTLGRTDGRAGNMPATRQEAQTARASVANTRSFPADACELPWPSVCTRVGLSAAAERAAICLDDPVVCGSSSRPTCAGHCATTRRGCGGQRVVCLALAGDGREALPERTDAPLLKHNNTKPPREQIHQLGSPLSPLPHCATCLPKLGCWDAAPSAPPPPAVCAPREAVCPYGGVLEAAAGAPGGSLGAGSSAPSRRTHAARRRREDRAAARPRKAVVGWV